MDRKLEKSRWRTRGARRTVLLFVAGVFGVTVLWTLPRTGDASRLRVANERVFLSRVKQGPFREYIRISGVVIPIRTVFIDAVEGGRVEEVYLEAGALVKEGEKILRLVNTNLILDIMNREAELLEHENNLRNTRLALAQSDLDLRNQILELDYSLKTRRRLHLANKGLKDLVPGLEYEQAQDEYEYLSRKRDLTVKRHAQEAVQREVQIEQLEGALARMKAHLDLVRRNLENLTVKAPVSGHLTSLNAELGESKRLGERLGRVDVLDGFKVRLTIDEHYLSRVHPGQGCEFSYSGQQHSLALEKIYPEVIDRCFEVDARFEGPEPEGVRRGQTVRVNLAIGESTEAVLLPRGAFFNKTGGRWVYVVDLSSATARKRAIRLGTQNPQHYEVLEGLEPGEWVVTSAYDDFGDVDELILEDSARLEMDDD